MIACLFETKLQKKLLRRKFQILHEQFVESRFREIELMSQFLNLDRRGGVFLEIIHDGGQFRVVRGSEIGAFAFPYKRIRFDVNHPYIVIAVRRRKAPCAAAGLGGKKNLEILLYLCDTSDGREAYRNRLFLTWFDHYAEKHLFTIRQAHAEIEGEGLFFCIIIDNRNPKLKDIVDDFEAKSALLTESKP